MKARCAETGWSSIRFLGFKNQSELPAFFDLCDVFVLVPDREGVATVIAEVMNAGKPLIISEAVGLGPDLVVDGENGFVVPARNPSILAERLRTITENPDLAARMGAKSLERIARWNIDATVRGILQALGATVGRPGALPRNMRPEPVGIRRAGDDNPGDFTRRFSG